MVFFYVSNRYDFTAISCSGSIFLHDGGTIAIIVSAIVIVIAALNLVLDFHFIESSAQYGSPQYMEWYGAFALMATLVWLYLEILRLVSYFARND
ncbi:hypothetical protein GCM10020331_065780 [Ectobacillus funiculus]